MKSVEHSLNPALPTEEDFGFGLGTSSADLALGRPWRQAGQLTLVWVFWSIVLAGVSLYYVIAGTDATRLLAWTAATAAAVLLAGAGVIRTAQPRASSARWTSLLYLAAFGIPLAQVLFGMVHTQDAGSSVLVLLLVIGYSIVAPSVESLLGFLTLTLAAWAACILRFPLGTWQEHVVPWFGAVALAMGVQQLRGKERLPALWSRRKFPSSPGDDLGLEEQLRTAQATRDELRTRCVQLEEQLHRPTSTDGRWEEDLFFLQESARDLARDVTLDEIGATWLERLRHRLRAKQASLWLSRGSDDFKLVLGLSECGPDDVMSILSRTVQSGQLLQANDAWGVPLDLGLSGRGVLLLQGLPNATPASATKLLHAAGACLTLYLRWQIADTENGTLAQQVHEVHENHHRARQDWETQDASQRSVSEQLKQHLHAVQAEVEQLRTGGQTESKEVAHWKGEADQAQQLLEQALAEHDTLSQLLAETEAEVKRLKAETQESSQLQQRLRQAEQDVAAASSGWQQAEEQLKQSEAARRRAEDEARDAIEEWQRETSSVSRLTLVLRTIGDPVAVFDGSGQAHFENDAAQALRGPVRNRPGEHPLWQAITPETLATARRDGQWQGEVFVKGPGQAGLPYDLTVRSLSGDGDEAFAITARSALNEVQQRQDREEIEASRAEAAGSGARFFAGLVRTLRPPVSGMIERAESLLENAADTEARRTDLLGLLRYTRHVRAFLTQAFDYASLEAGTAAVVKVKHSPWQLLHDVVHQHRSAAEERGITLNVLASGNLPPTMTTDGERFRGIVGELIGVALRRLQSGAITVRMGMEPTSPVECRTPRLQVELELPTVVLREALLEPFAEEGTGLELVVAKRGAEVLGGELRLDKLAPKGSRLTFLTPVTAVEYAASMPVDQLPLDQSVGVDEVVTPLHGWVLLVADDHETQRAVTFHLERLGLRTAVATDGAVALQRVKDEAFHAVIWDLNNEDLPASQMAAHLRSAAFAGAIVALAKHPGRQEADTFLSAGGHAVLSLPVVLAHWRQTLASYLPQVETENDSPEVETVRSEFEGDRDFLPLVRQFVARLPGQVAHLRAALQVADLATLARHTHALAEHAAVYGYPRLADAARHVEQTILQGGDSHGLNQALDALGTTVTAMERGINSILPSGILTLPQTRGLAA